MWRDGERNLSRTIYSMAESGTFPIPVRVVALLPTPAGCATFLTPVDSSGKTTVIFIDSAVGAFINLQLSGQEIPRPMTHHLMRDMMKGMGIELRGACVVRTEKGVYFCRLIVEMQNEISEMKVVELDSRPGDALALTLLEDCPFTIRSDIWEGMEDVAAKLQEIRESTPEGEGPDFFDD